MTGQSKQPDITREMFYRSVEGVRCRDMVHPWTASCSKATLNMLLSSLYGSYKFYAVLYIIQNLIKGKKKSKELLIKQFKLYLRSGCFGGLAGMSFVTVNCLIRNFLWKKFHYYDTVFVPCFVGGFGILFEPPHRRALVIDTFFNLVLEYWVKTLAAKGIIKRSTAVESLIFMLGSSYLFYLMRQEKTRDKKLNLLWFFEPPKVNVKQITNSTNPSPKHNNNYCPHTESCPSYVLKGTAQMFGIGCAMSMLRTIVPKLGNPIKAFKSITKKQFKLGLFLGGYIGIYRLVSCLMCNKYKEDKDTHALPAGFLAGSAIIFNPNLAISLATITSILHILCGRAYDKKLLPEKWPLPEILYACCQGLLYHTRVMHPNECPNYIFNVMNSGTNGRVDEIYGAFLKFIHD